MVLRVECEKKYGSVVLLHFVGCLPALTTELKYTFSQFYSKNKVDGAEALSVRKLGRCMVFSFVLAVDEMMNKNDGCKNVTVCHGHC